MNLRVYFPDTAFWGASRMRCALGGAGVGVQKREGDGMTPVGAWRMMFVFYRPDRLARCPASSLEVKPLRPTLGWCDEPADEQYNRLVELPYVGRAERLWRDDHVYDLIVPLAYNTDPVVPGQGSAIFLHLARPGYAATEGCVALSLEDLLKVVAEGGPTSQVIVYPLGTTPN